MDAAGLTVGVVAARWHAELTDHMLDRAVAAAEACGADDVVVARVAGSVELPVVAQALARAVRRGGRARRGHPRRDRALRLRLPVGHRGADPGRAGRRASRSAHGVLTVDTIEQARDRAGLPGSAEDKGWAATVAALDAALAVRTVSEEAGQRVGFGR